MKIYYTEEEEGEYEVNGIKTLKGKNKVDRYRLQRGSKHVWKEAESYVDEVKRSGGEEEEGFSITCWQDLAEP